MAITHPKPTEETPTNHGEATPPSPEIATKKHGKMFKAGAAGLAALGIAGAAFVAGRGSGESEPQKVTNDAPVAESTLPGKTETAPDYTALLTRGFNPSPAQGLEGMPDKEFEKRSEENKDLAVFGREVARPAIEKERRATNNSYVDFDTCVSFSNNSYAQNGERHSVRVFFKNPIVYREDNLTTYVGIDGDSTYSVTIEDDKGNYRAAPAYDDIRIDELGNAQSNYLVKFVKSYSDADADPSEYNLAHPREDYDDVFAVGVVANVADNGDLAQDNDARLEVCKNL